MQINIGKRTIFEKSMKDLTNLTPNVCIMTKNINV